MKRTESGEKASALQILRNIEYVGPPIQCGSNKYMAKPGTKKGSVFTKEHREALSLAHMGQKAWNKGKETPIDTRMKLSSLKKGEKNNNWKGGIWPANRRDRDSIQYKIWRKSVLERDGHRCVIGGIAHGMKLHADHIKRFADYPKLRFEISNGRTLCEDCHRKTDTWGSKKRKG